MTCPPVSTPPGPLDSVTLIDIGHVLEVLGGGQGPAGPEGPQGIQGPVGPTGDTGSTGATGAQGAQGLKGDPGAKGDKGDKGDAGTSVQIQGSVPNSASLPTGLGPADAGKGWITEDTGHLWVWGGASYSDVGLVRGPQGPAGPEGAQGIQGPVGPAGSNGTNGTNGATGAQGPTGATGPTGAQGPAGPSDWNAIPNKPVNLVYSYVDSPSPAVYALKIWAGTEAQYQALTVKDAATLYFRT